jgi:hypothetical protein
MSEVFLLSKLASNLVCSPFLVHTPRQPAAPLDEFLVRRTLWQLAEPALPVLRPQLLLPCPPDLRRCSTGHAIPAITARPRVKRATRMVLLLDQPPVAQLAVVHCLQILQLVLSPSFPQLCGVTCALLDT